MPTPEAWLDEEYRARLRAFGTPVFRRRECVCACKCGNFLTDEDQFIVGWGICDDCDYCGPLHGCEHPQHPYYRPDWPGIG